MTFHSIGVPYHSWRISVSKEEYLAFFRPLLRLSSSQHAKHHAQTSHLTGDQAFVPNTRQDWGLPALDTQKENLEGTVVSSDMSEVFEEVLEYSPFKSIYWLFFQLVCLRWCLHHSGLMFSNRSSQFLGWPAYLVMNAKGQKSYPPWTNRALVVGKPRLRTNV